MIRLNLQFLPSLSSVYLLLSQIFSISLSQMYISSEQHHPSISPTLRFHLAIFFSVCFTFSFLPSLPISLVLCPRQFNPSDFKNHIIQSGPTQWTGADPEGQTNQLSDGIRPPTCPSFQRAHTGPVA